MVPVGLVAAIYLERTHLAVQNAIRVQRECDRALKGATSVKAWAAGMRQAREDRFCGCPAVRPRVVYESSDAAEMGDLVTAFACRPFNDLGDKPGACTPLTIEFYRGNELTLSMNFKGSDSFCSRWSTDGSSHFWLPLTEEGERKLDAWISKNDLWTKVLPSLK
jgi:hypothetical protein